MNGWFEMMTVQTWVIWYAYLASGIVWVIGWLTVLRFYGDDPLSRTIKHVAIAESALNVFALIIVPMPHDTLPIALRSWIVVILPLTNLVAGTAVIVGGYQLGRGHRERDLDAADRHSKQEGEL